MKSNLTPEEILNQVIEDDPEIGKLIGLDLDPGKLPPTKVLSDEEILEYYKNLSPGEKMLRSTGAIIIA